MYCCRKRNPSVENKLYLVHCLVYISDSMEFRQLSIRKIVSSWSKFPVKGTGLWYLLDSFFWSELSDFRWVSDQNAALLLPPGRVNISQKKKQKNEKKNEALEMVPDQNQLRSKTFLIRPKCARFGYDQTQMRSKRLWSDPIALDIACDQTSQTKLTSDQTISRPRSRLFRSKFPLNRPSPDHRPDCSALELPSRPCNFGLGTHGCALDWVWS